MDLSTTLERINNKNRFLYLIGGYIGLFAHPIYWYIWTYVFPGFYESAILRFSCAALSLPVIFFNKLPIKIKTYFPFYWFFIVMLQLPITFTYLTLMNKFAGMWLICETMMILVLGVFFQNFVAYIFNLIGGITIAIVLYSLQTTVSVEFDQSFIVLVTPIPIAIFCLVVFSHAIRKGNLLEETNDLLKNLGGSIAHEMRNPLNSILIAIEEIESLHCKENPIGLKTISLTKTCKEMIKNGNSIINITLENIQGKPIDSQSFTCLAFNACMNSVLDSYAFRTGERAKVTFKNHHDFHFMGDASLFSYTMFNLLKNALYYLKSYPESRIEITAHHIHGKNMVIFRDTGPGIPARLIPKLFDGFTTFGKAEGTGLGLPFCKRVMDSFGGSIYCRSVEGQYTEFILTFPTTDQTHKEPIENNTTSILEDNLKNKLVLLVDDDVTSTAITSKYLIRSGVTCDIAVNGKVAVEMLQQKPYQVVFMDFQMPIMDGIEATKAIRENVKFNNIAIIGLTGTSSKEEVQEALDAGMNDYLIKPVRRDQLINKLNNFLN